MATTKDCGDRLCTLTFQILTNCIVYIKPPNSTCEIPCNLNGCHTDVYHDVSCPVWSCADKPTSTSTTSPTTTANPPFPDQDPGCTSKSCIIAVTFSILFGLAMIFWFFAFLRYRQILSRNQNNLFDEERTPIIRVRRQNQDQAPTASAFGNQERAPLARGFENVPLSVVNSEQETAFWISTSLLCTGYLQYF